jgi:hypothetical protein
MDAVASCFKNHSTQDRWSRADGDCSVARESRDPDVPVCAEMYGCAKSRR